MKFKYSLLVLPAALLLLSCGNNATIEEKSDDASKEMNEEKALSLMSTNCFVCHNPDMESETRVAPPMFKIREHYYDDETSREEFINEIVAFALDPTLDKSIMPGAVNNFGLMPKTPFNEEDLKLIAGYIYDNDLASDKWYAKWEKFEKVKGTNTGDLDYLELGRSIANQTKSELGRNLMAAIKRDGPAKAVDFCNTRAIPLTDSMSMTLNAKVKRVTDKVRNPKNVANKEESAYIEELKAALLKGDKLKPKVTEMNGKIFAYYPIETNAMCLKCHGTPNKTIVSATMTAIKNKYPNDKAIGYKTNEIRGIFVVEMNKTD